MNESEEQLRAWMTLSLDGDGAAHAALLRALVPLLRSFFRRRVNGADDDAEDLVQETLIAVHARRCTYDRDRPFTAWLYAIARHRLIDLARRNRVTVSIDDVDSILMTEGFEDAIGARLDVDGLLASLTPKQARAIRDTHLCGMSVAEAASAAGIGESDVKVSVHRGLKALAAKLRKP